jgi:two-component system sensor histidine kinase BaeS
LRRRLTFFFAFVALAAVTLTTWFTLGAVYTALFGNSADAGPFRPWQGWNGNWSEWWQRSSPQFRQAGEIFARITGTAFLAGTISFLLAVLAAAIVTRILTRPLIALTDGAKRLEAGERGIRLKVPRSQDELRGLTEAFNNLVTGLERQETWRRNLVADIAHDLRTPLAVLRSEIEAMQDGVVKLDNPALERLHGQVTLLTKLVNDLRTLSLAESGGLELKKEKVEVMGFLSTVIEGFRPRALEAGLELRLESPSSKLNASFDQGQITRVLNNLLDNAVRYASPGRVEVSAVDGRDSILIRLRDHGPGISPKALERIFERFYKADSSRTRIAESGGSGLGLSIARAIVEAHGGKLEATNHAEGGAVFTVWLPR